MRTTRILLAVAVVVAAQVAPPAPAAGPPDPPPGFPKFQAQEIDAGLSIGYAVVTADLNGDGKPDIVVVDKHKVVWYENPTWKKRVILDGKTTPDNVCVAAVDIDGGGDLELVVGAAWKPFDTKTPGTLQWLKRGKTLDEEWSLHPIPCDEPTVHRIQAIDLDRDGKPEIVSVPLMGREATAKGNWLDGRPVRITAYPIPKEPTVPANWKPVVLSEELHVTHNFSPDTMGKEKVPDIVVASYEGVSVLTQFHREGQTPKWNTMRIHEANQSNPKGNRGASEVKFGVPIKGVPCVATVEPWHGNQVVVYPAVGGFTTRHVIDDHLRWGHAVTFADLDGDKVDELIVGVRDDPNVKAGDKFTERRGVRVYKNTDGKGAKWDRYLLDDGGVAVEDLTAADLDGDGKVDLIAVGRATGNCRVYWNKGVGGK